MSEAIRLQCKFACAHPSGAYSALLLHSRSAIPLLERALGAVPDHRLEHETGVSEVVPPSYVCSISSRRVRPAGTTTGGGSSFVYGRFTPLSNGFSAIAVPEGFARRPTRSVLPAVGLCYLSARHALGYICAGLRISSDKPVSTTLFFCSPRRSEHTPCRPLAIMQSLLTSTSWVTYHPFTLNFNSSRSIRRLGEYVYTLWLFTRSDLKTVLFPTLVFGTAAAPISSTAHITPRALWIWLHLLQFCVSNQSFSPDEDASNKPWRPIPSKRIMPSSARRLRWALLVLCLLLSRHYGLVPASVALALGTLVHNELGMDAHWLPRNICNAVGYAAFNAGATYIGCNNGCPPKTSSIAAQVLNALVILTTIQAQDFQDTDGDRATGRRTLPIVFPESSRWMTALLLLGWSAFLSVYWQVSTAHATILAVSAVVPGLRFVSYRTSASDRTSYRLYNLWLCVVHVTPFVVSWS